MCVYDFYSFFHSWLALFIFFSETEFEYELYTITILIYILIILKMFLASGKDIHILHITVL